MLQVLVISRDLETGDLAIMAGGLDMTDEAGLALALVIVERVEMGLREQLVEKRLLRQMAQPAEEKAE